MHFLMSITAPGNIPGNFRNRPLQQATGSKLPEHHPCINVTRIGSTTDLLAVMFTKLTSRRKKKTDKSKSSTAGVDNRLSKVSQADSKGSLTIAPNESGALGLNVIYTPDIGHKVDIIFIHGLGGTSKWTWSKYKNPELFWPLTFLPLDVSSARISTFGYNASFQKPGSVVLSILDFAKDLLFDLKYGKDKDLNELDMGKVPIIFVAHSMGGLVVKEAYIQGQNDPEYESIIKAITAINFLATPHRGTDLAQTLNRLLDSIMVNSKQYVAELARNSLTIQKLNEQFRHVAPRLDIISFYETLPTSIGLRSIRVMVVEKDSSVLGYPGEVSKALVADHHGICKYEGPQDPNYISVRNVLKSLVTKVIAKESAKSSSELSDQRTVLDLKLLLALHELPGADYIFFRDQWTEGTNNWVKQENAFLQWRDSSEHLNVLWISGGAATGKSILASTIINNLVEEGRLCQYFSIRFGDHRKRTLNYLLRSLAFQMAHSVPALMQRLTTLTNENIDFETVDPRIIWDRIFRSIVFKFEVKQPWYWVVDGLDEAEDPRAIIRQLLDVPSTLPIRILFISRQTSEIKAAFDRRPKLCRLQTISIEGHVEDIQFHVRKELRVPGSDGFKDTIERRIVEGSQTNFLWTRLVVEKVNRCHTQEDVESALRELPHGMQALYDRMAGAISDLSNPRDKSLATNIIQCLTCSLRVLSLSEMTQALGEAATGILDLPHTIRALCGDFAVVDNDGNVSIVHKTARDYLLNPEEGRFGIDWKVAHKQMFLSSMQCLMSLGLRTKLSRSQQPDFLDYAAGSWSSHLRHSSLHDQDVATILKKFLTRTWVLNWIQALATTGQLRTLIHASKDLSTVASQSMQQGLALGVLDNELLSSWSVDLLRVVGRFHGPLQRKPDSIYSLIPPFCPKGSAIHQQFGKTGPLTVKGLSSEKWDDLLAKISLGKSFASSIQAAGSLVAVLVDPGVIHIHEASDFRALESSPINHGERVYRIQLNKAASLMATYGYQTTKVWKIASGECIISVESIQTKTRPLAMMFTDDDSNLLVGTCDRRLRSLSLGQPEPEWENFSDIEEQMQLEQYVTNSASHMALSLDGSLVAVAYRGHPVSVWETDGPMHIGHCRRQNESVAFRELRDLVWHPYQPEVLGLNIEGVVFRWAPYEDTVDEIPTGATRLSVSNDGELFVTGDAYGRVKLYTTSSFTLLHQFSAQDAVIGLTFSPDSQRFYDIRGYYANVWEPMALARYANHTKIDTDPVNENSSARVPKESNISLTAIDPVTVLSGSPKGRLYCVGTQMGSFSLHDTRNGKLATLYASKAKFAIENIAWSDDGKHICCSDFSKQVIVFAVSQDSQGSSPTYEQKASISMRQVTKGPITQLLFHGESSYILIYTSTQIHVISLSSYAVEKSRELDMAVHRCILYLADQILLSA
ncbi:Vegetative incompatibility protein HET-E-1 [Cytospora mali]|uniref:Vegetative incompatibility protein HET-E-1 n=1 Tax=Cytospora mali TaxID=578113 RepID=A0A194UM60_CYTMA|nr:Vegetative incompatibility protein HET-E-1 [Valsa mali var. pyri (nom. inval.)]